MSIASPRASRPARTLGTTALLVAVGATTLAAGGLAGTSARVSTPTDSTRDVRASGMTFNYTVSSGSSDKKQREASDVNAMVRMQDGNIRMDYTGGTNPMGTKGGYVVIDGKQKLFMIVNPKEKAVMAMEAGTLGSGMGAMLNNPLIKITISNQSFRFKDLGAGESMLGYKTRHVRLFNSSTMNMRILGRSKKTSSSDSSDQWVAQGMDMDNASLLAWARSFSSGVKSTNPELATELERYQKEYSRTGLALRSVTWSTVTDDKGNVTSDSLTMQVTDIKKGSIDASIFVIPSDYVVTNLGEVMAAAKAGMDSAKIANAAAGKDTTSITAKGVAKEVGKESAKDAIKSGLGGLFKKKKP